MNIDSEPINIEYVKELKRPETSKTLLDKLKAYVFP